MIFKAKTFVFLVAVAVLVCAEEPIKPVEPTGIIDANPEVVTSPQPTPTTKPTEKPTQTPSPTTSTQTPATPTDKPTTTTTVKPTTTTTTTPTTTPSTTSSTTTPATPTTTPKPAPTTPAPIPPKNESWIVTGTNGTVCIIANMVIKISVPYKSIENKTVESNFSVDKVENATAGGSCTAGNNTENLVLTWSNVSATFNFVLNPKEKTYSLSFINVTIAVNNVTFPNNTMTNVTKLQLNYEGNLFNVSQNNSYTCTTVAPMSLLGATYPLTNTTVNGKLTVAHVHVQAFGTETKGKFMAPVDCASTNTPDIVPIAVGLILAGLVVVVLVAYLVGRRRAQSRGYLSM